MFGSLGTLIYRMLMDGVNVAGLDATERAAVKTTIGGAVETARALQDSVVPAWLEVARQSFSTGFASCCLIAGVTLLVLAVIARKIYARANVNEQTVTSAH
ncbi:hypothetical protein [Neorhizobium galegae]|uniref:hypothetical protein n=1 Tax=Neorhizobium galegae TaxID=399 RepID=UPI00062207EB|nr:hypothetical protein [Neorhizobium galegae]MCQ1807514.1 hypothetical protein [Neorhizobium galegae]CDZ56978.1 Hypothetical protein NGAL_HAMBI2566_15300 [Neorhizobium galegae bv. orientalis]